MVESENTTIIFAPPPISNEKSFFFLLGPFKSQDKLETILMQNLEEGEGGGDKTRSIMVFSEVAYRDLTFYSAAVYENATKQ